MVSLDFFNGVVETLKVDNAETTLTALATKVEELIAVYFRVRIH